MALKDLLAKMRGEVPSPANGEEKSKVPSTDEMIDSTMPSDQDLQDRKARRHKTADDVTDWLSQRGWPALGAVAGTVTDMTADMIPESRKDWENQLASGGGAVGSIEGKAASKLSKMAMPEARAVAGKASTTAEINAALRTAHPQVVQEALANPDALGKQGLKYIEELEKKRVAQTAANGREIIGAKDPSQRAKVRSNPAPGTLDYTNKFNPTFKKD